MAFVPFTKDDQPTMAAFNEKFQQAIDEAVSRGVKIEVGSYVGTGTYGKSNPNSLYVGTNCVKVEIRAIYSSNSIGSPFLELHPQAATETWRDLAYFYNGSLDTNSHMRIVDGVLYWYSNSVDAQGNANGVQHTYSIFKK